MKEERQRAILGLLRDHSAHTQRELADQLVTKGFPVTQATISRDIQELGVVRRSDGYLVPPGNGHGFSKPVRQVLPELVRSVTQVEFLMIIKTSSGSANLVAEAIDETDQLGVAGTLAGDNTILVVLGDSEAGDKVRRFLGVD